jgi:hypothetical protein
MSLYFSFFSRGAVDDLLSSSSFLPPQHVNAVATTASIIKVSIFFMLKSFIALSARGKWKVEVEGDCAVTNLTLNT